MKSMNFVVFAFLSILMIGRAPASEQAPRSPAANLPYPAEVSLINEPNGGWTYRQSGTSLPLYFSDRDSRGKSMCNKGCTSQWAPLEAPTDAKTIGLWTVSQQKDGPRQWAYKNHPIYIHIHDTPEAPNGDGIDGVWHLMPHFE
jgi:predicted lipoprotein with Yx(FWY)xxD motif